ncbi:MAG: EamA family transporter [Lachnospiraceae bacterium]|nr:EamA family transporter [Lachnospiraceae bacterium]
MIYLLLAIVCSTMVSVIMRLSKKYVKNNMFMFFSNYVICTLMAGLFMGKTPIFESGEGMIFAVVLGLISGVFYLGGFFLLQYNIIRNGMVLASTFMKLGVLVPTAMAVILFKETPKPAQFVGFVIALIAIVIINTDGESDDTSVEKEDEKQKEKKTLSAGSGTWLIVLLLVGGFTDSLVNVYEKMGVDAFKDHYLLVTFVTAGVCSIIMGLAKRQRPTKADILWGAMIGVPNYLVSRFLLLSLGSMSAIVVYPVYNVAAILLVSVIGVLCFKEKIGKRKGAGLILVLIALIVLNI